MQSPTVAVLLSHLKSCLPLMAICAVVFLYAGGIDWGRTGCNGGGQSKLEILLLKVNHNKRHIVLAITYRSPLMNDPQE